MAPRRGKRGPTGDGQQTLSFWMRSKEAEGGLRDRSRSPAQTDSSVLPEDQQSDMSDVGVSSTVKPSLRQRLAARGAEMLATPQARESLKGNVPKFCGQQKLIFQSPPPDCGDKSYVATPCRSPCRSDLRKRLDLSPKEEDAPMQLPADGAGEKERATSATAKSSTTAASSDVRDDQAAQADLLQMREQEASEEVARILQLQEGKRAFRSELAWAKAVLGLDAAAAEVSLVHQAFRSLMRKLHPDRIGACDGATEAMDELRQAKQLCEHKMKFAELHPPAAPIRLASAVLCAAPGRRRIRISWQSPTAVSSPIRKYLVAALDPSFGQPLTITVLEPEYNDELKRYLSLDELTSCVLAEEDLVKMPAFFQQSAACVYVAAANEAGQSKWATISVPLRGPAAPTVGEVLTSPSRAKADKADSAKSTPAKVSAKQCKDFETTAHSLLKRPDGAAELCAWLRKQSRGLLASWLQSQAWPTKGSKAELVDRVAFAVGAIGKAN
ncbi:unnamed protein product [Symbiodinium sp. CCMP2456]|nr:unnamed protein product [Symbiodinium sp. CCMP2456]